MTTETAEHQISQLQAFLTATDELELPLDPDVEKAIDYAESLLDEMTAPVRVAVAGGRRTGKSTLVNLLAGVDIVPSGPDAHLLPPVILRFSEKEQTLAGWWDRPEKIYEGLNVSEALAQSPDVISFEIDCEALKELWLIDVSGVDHRSRGKEARFALSRLADVLLWCSDAATADLQAESQNWQLLPPHLRKHSLLVISRDNEAGNNMSPEVSEIIGGGRQTPFRQVVPIAISQAWQALVNEGENFEQQWDASGAADLIETLMSAVEVYRTDRLQRTRRAMQRFVVPAMTKIGCETVKAPAAPSPVEIVAERRKEAQSAPADPLAGLLSQWHEGLGALKSQFDEGTFSDAHQIIEAAQQQVNSFIDEIVDSGAMSEQTDWLITEFEKADDLLILLQFEDTDLVIPDAMRVLWQLSDCLSWAGRRDADYHAVA